MNRNVSEGSRIIGLDLSKKTFCGCILSGDDFEHSSSFTGRMSQDDRGWQLIRSHIGAHDLVLMEAGTASFSLARYLQTHSAAEEIIVLNPGTLRVIWMSQRKNDKADAKKIACIARDMHREAWPTVDIPTAEEQAERFSITSYVFCKHQETKLVNRLYALYNSLGYPDVPRKAIRDDRDARRQLADSVLAAYPAAREEADLLIEELDLVQRHIAIKLDHLRTICLRHPKQALSWLSIPGIGLINTATLIAYIGDGSRFSNAHQLLNYAGLVPKQDQSGTVDKHLGISHRGNAYIRRNIIQGGWVTTKMKPDCPITKYAYHKLKEGKQKQKVAVAVANKMLRTGFALLKSGELYTPMIEEGLCRFGEKLRSYKLQALMTSIPQD